MYPLRLISPVLLAALAGCATVEGRPVSAPEAPAPEVAAPEDTLPAPEPEVPLEDRWREPFAVQSVGRIGWREPRPTVVRMEQGSAARPDTVPLAAVAVDTPASRPAPAPPRPADPPRTAARPAPASGGGSSTPASTRTPGNARRTHEVRPGETFFGVARRYNVTADALRAANPGVDPDRLRSGTTLWIPGAAPASSGSGAARPASGAPARPPAARPANRTHRVVSGDTLFGIAQKYGVSAAAIRAANRMENDVVKLGQTLVIPGS